MLVQNSILKWVGKFNSHGNDENRSGSGRPSTSNENVQAVSNYFRSNLRKSVRRAESDLVIFRSTFHRILKRIIHMFQYKVTRVQHLLLDEFVQCKAVATRCIDNLLENQIFFAPHRLF